MSKCDELEAKVKWLTEAMDNYDSRLTVHFLRNEAWGLEKRKRFCLHILGEQYEDAFKRADQSEKELNLKDYAIERKCNELAELQKQNTLLHDMLNASERCIVLANDEMARLKEALDEAMYFANLADWEWDKNPKDNSDRFVRLELALQQLSNQGDVQ
jgi:hypothetical protein